MFREHLKYNLVTTGYIVCILHVEMYNLCVIPP